MADENKEIIDNYAGFTGAGGVVEDALTKAKNEGNYRDYYNQVMQNRAANEYARRYYQSSLQAQGLASQGAGATASAMLANQMYNANAEALAQYRQNVAQQGEQDAAVFSQNVLNFGTSENYQQMLKDHGFMDAEGNYTDKFNSLSDSAKGTIMASISQFEAPQRTGLQINQSNIKDVLGVDDKLNWEIDNASTALDKGYFKTRAGDTVQLEDGMVLKLSGSDGKAVKYVIYDADSKSYYQATEEDYNNQKGNKYGNYNGAWSEESEPKKGEKPVKEEKPTTVEPSDKKEPTGNALNQDAYDMYFERSSGRAPREGDKIMDAEYKNGQWVKIEHFSQEASDLQKRTIKENYKGTPKEGTKISIQGTVYMYKNGTWYVY